MIPVKCVTQTDADTLTQGEKLRLKSLLPGTMKEELAGKCPRLDDGDIAFVVQRIIPGRAIPAPLFFPCEDFQTQAGAWIPLEHCKRTGSRCPLQGLQFYYKGQQPIECTVRPDN